GVKAADVTELITPGISEAQPTRAATRLPLDRRTAMMLAVTNKNGEILGLFRMPDATFFSIDVSVAKARNVAYYADPAKLQPIDQVPGVPAGAAPTDRSFRYPGGPRVPLALAGSPPPPLADLYDGR